MRPPEQISPERLNELREFRKTKWPGNEFKRFFSEGLVMALAKFILPVEWGHVYSPSFSFPRSNPSRL